MGGTNAASHLSGPNPQINYSTTAAQVKEPRSRDTRGTVHRAWAFGVILNWVGMAVAVVIHSVPGARWPQSSCTDAC